VPEPHRGGDLRAPGTSWSRRDGRLYDGPMPLFAIERTFEIVEVHQAYPLAADAAV